MKDPMKINVWLGFLILIVLLVPWYFSQSFGKIIIFGLPLWALLIILFLICLVAYINYVISTKWDIEKFIK